MYFFGREFCFAVVSFSLKWYILFVHKYGVLCVVLGITESSTDGTKTNLYKVVIGFRFYRWIPT